MAGKTVTLASEIVLGDRIAVIDAQQAYGLPVTEYNRNGVVLLNERVKVFLPDADGVGREFTASIYLQRVPLTDDETAEVAKVATERKANADAKKTDEQNRLAREKQAAFQLGQDATMSALRNISALSEAARTLAKIG